MTQFLGVRNMARWMARDGVENIIGTMASYIEADYARWEEFEKIPRVAGHTPLGVIELMPTTDHELYSFKYVNGHPSNPARGLQTVVAFGALASVDSGYPLLVTEMTLLTALRTAATSAMAAKALARPDSRVLALIGSGSQSEFQALGFRSFLGIDTVRIYDIDPEAMEKFRRNLAPLGFRIHVADSVADAVAGADIVTTCTADKTHNTILRPADVADSVHLNAVGGDCPGKTELDARILERASVFVEYEPQTRIEGEIQQMPGNFPVTAISDVLTGRASGRTSAEDVTLFDSVGFAIADFSGLRCAADMTAGTEFLDEIDLIAGPDDPKDLFSLVDVVAPVS